jgi:hypothetical protein
MEKVRVTPSFQLGIGICVWKKWGTSLLVICSLGFFLSIWPSRTLYTVFTTSVELGGPIIAHLWTGKLR